MSLKICFSILSRANFSRVKSVIKGAIENPNIIPIVIVGCGAICDDYGNILEDCKAEGIKIHEKISTLMHDKSDLNMVRTTALGMFDYSMILEKYKPDAAITVADRYETIGFAISCAYMKIPLIHLQGGEPTGCIDDKVRNAIAQLADYHFVCNDYAYNLTINWGENNDRVFNVGCPSLDHIKKIESSEDFKKKFYLINKKLKTNINFSEKYCVLLFHPDTRKENQDFDVVIQSVIKFVENNKIGLIILNPNPDSGSKEIQNQINKIKSDLIKNEISNKIFIIKNLDSDNYLTLIQGCQILIGNSSSGIREASFLGIKSLNIGNRQQYRFKSSNVTDSKISSSEIYEKLQKLFLQKKPNTSTAYGDGNSAKKIISLIQKINFSLKPTKI